MVHIYDMIILGGGPAGYSAALYAARAGMDTLVLEKMSAGGQMALTDIIDNYPGFDEGVDGFTLGMKMQQGAERFGAKSEYGEVQSVNLTGEIKTVVTDSGEYQSRTVVIATGANPRPLGLPEEASLVGRGLHYCAHCDGRFYKDKTVMVIGGGNSAVSDALYLSRLARKVYLVHRRDAFRGAKVYENKIRETENIELVTKSVIDEIRGGNAGMDSVVVRNVENGDIRVIEAEGLFVYVGMAPVSSFLPSQVERDAAGFIVTDAEMCTSAPGIFAAGDVRAKRCRQVSSAVGDGATAATAALTYLEHWNA